MVKARSQIYLCLKCRTVRVTKVECKRTIELDDKIIYIIFIVANNFQKYLEENKNHFEKEIHITNIKRKKSFLTVFHD